MQIPHFTQQSYDRYGGSLPTFAEQLLRRVPAEERSSNADGPFECLFYPFQSAAKPSDCPADCNQCQGHYRPARWQDAPDYRYTSKQDDETARQIIADLVRKVQQDLSKVRELLDVHGDAILKRWQKGSVKKRADMLQAIMPRMKQHRFSSAQYTNPQHCSKQARNSQTTMAALTERIHWLLPYLDVETFSVDHTKLLSLLHSRSSSPPATFFAFDLAAHQGFWDNAQIAVSYNAHCVVAHGDAFGEVVQWDKEAAHRFDIVGYPRAEIGLEAQQALASFLRRIVEAILSPPSDKLPRGRDRWNDMFIAHTSSSPLVRGVTVTEHSPTTAPVWNASEIVEILRSRYHDAIDELSSLQTDPLYLRERIAAVQDTNYFRALPRDEQNDYLVQQTLGQLRQVDTCLFTWAEATSLQRILDQSSDSVHAGQALPSEYREALQLLRHILKSQLSTLLDDCWTTAVRHGVSDTTQHVLMGEGSSIMRAIKNPESTLRKDPIFWNVLQFTTISSESPSYHVGFMDSVLSNATKNERARIDRSFLKMLSDVVVVDEALAKLNLHRPAFGPQPDEQDLKRLIKAHSTICASLKIVQELAAVRGFAELTVTQRFEEFLDLPLPSNKASRETLKRTEKLYEALDNFWCAVRRERYQVVARMGLPEEELAKCQYITHTGSSEGLRELADRELEDLRAAIEAKETVARARLPENKRPPVSPKTADPLQTVWGCDNEKRISLPTVKDKPKTRPSLVDSVTTAVAQVELEDVADPIHTEVPIDTKAGAETIGVTTYSLALFQRMFSSLATAKSTASVKWDDFVTAMKDAGCVVRQNGGSAVMFIHQASDGASRSVVVHRPHPDPRINPIMLGSFGKKLGRRLGWSTETFVERGSTS